MMQEVRPEPSIQFQIPESCPVLSPLACSLPISSKVSIEEIMEEEDGATDPMRVDHPQNSQEQLSAQNGKHKGKASLTPLVESMVRRSTRVKGKTGGYKSESCRDKNCIACSAQPPTICTKIIRNLGANFCNIPVQELDDEALNMKKGKKQPVGAGKASKKSTKYKSDEDAAQPSKKSKKK